MMWWTLFTYLLGVGVGFLWGALWAASFVHRKTGVRPYDLKRQR